MKIKSIASSSAGNCYHISDGVSQLLIECGIPIQRIRRHVDLTKIDGCLITHEHMDHAKAARDIVKYTHIYASKGTMDNLDLGPYKYRSDYIKNNSAFKVGSFTIVPFLTQHDAAEPLGFLIYSVETKEELLFATDTYYIHPSFGQLDYIMVECNFDGTLLKEAVDNCKIHKAVANRLWTSHFELKRVKEFLQAQDLSKTKAIYLMHLSDGLSNAKRFKKEIMQLTGIPVVVCKK